MGIIGDLLFSVGFGAVESLVSVPALFYRGLTKRVLSNPLVIVIVLGWIQNGGSAEETQASLSGAWNALTTIVDQYRGIGNK